MPEHNHAHGRNRQLPPSALVGQDGVQEGRVRGVEHHPVPAVGPQFERLVTLEHEDGFGIEPGREHRRYLAPAEFQARPEPLHINPVVPDGVVGQAKKQFAVHLGEAPQFEPPE